MDLKDIHADDYAVSVHASEDLITCMQEEKLDSISVIPNMACFDRCMDMLQEVWQKLSKKPLISVHLNFMEGHCISPVEEVKDLVDEKGYFKVSWGSLVLVSYYPGRRKTIMKQLQTEIEAQIERIQASLPEGCELRLDSHQHTHMIPVVFDAMIAAIEEKQYPITFIRVAREPIVPFLKKVSLYGSYNVINIVKNVILNIYAGKVDRQLVKIGLQPTLLWGLIMTGHMDLERVQKLYPAMLQYGKHKQKQMEILFHPGTVLPTEITEEYVKAGFIEFHLSEGRKIERHAVDEMNWTDPQEAINE